MSKYDIFVHLMENNQWSDFEDFAKFNYFNRKYSIFNSALILLQKPGATIVKSENQWNQSGRCIKPEASPMLILQPRGPVMPVYDYSDTYGESNDYEKIVEKMSLDFRNRRKYFLDEECYKKFLERLNHYGILYSERSFGERQYGITAPLEYPQKTYYTKKNRKRELVEVSVDAYYQITINSILDFHTKILTLFHELGHLYCGHLKGGKKTEQNNLPEYRGEYLNHDTKEYEAEMVCKILCERNNIADNCEEYLKQHMINGTVPPYDKSAVFLAVDKIRTLLEIS